MKEIIEIKNSIVYLFVLISLCGCSLTNDLRNPQAFSPENVENSTAMVSWFDAIDVMSGICFESAFDAVGRTFIIRNEDELFTFFNLADNSRLCRWKVDRYPFEFGQNNTLAGTWSYGFGCTAGHDVLDVSKDDESLTIRFTLEFYTEGDCPYELVRPFWIGIRDAQGYDIILDVIPREPEPVQD